MKRSGLFLGVLSGLMAACAADDDPIDPAPDGGDDPPAAVDFTVRKEGDALAFTVADHGPGVPEAERDRIFAPFYRPAGGPPDVGGAGLGLAIARGLAEAQGGALTHAPREGGGSVFTLRLPAAELDDVLLA